MTAQLTRFQVDLALSPVDERKHLTDENMPGSVKLERELDNISDHWPATTPHYPKYLQTLVELPSGIRWVHWASKIALTVSRLSSTSFLTLLHFS